MIVCFDIGGTAIKGAIAYSADDIRPVPRIKTPIDDFAAFVDALKSVVAIPGTPPRCIAISIAGVMDPDTQTAVVANVPCIHGRRLREDLERALGLPVLIANDADCFVLAEAGLGAARGHRVVFGIILGTGVGGGLVVDGQLINRDGGFAGEWGHAPVAATQAGEPPAQLPRFQCGCGLAGCIDATCSARGMEKLHRHLHVRSLTSEEIVDAWSRKDPEASRTVEIYIELLSAPLAMVANVTGTTIIPVGGGLSNCRPLIEAVDSAVRRQILRKFNRPLVVPAQCIIEPGLMGAAILGLAFRA